MLTGTLTAPQISAAGYYLMDNLPAAFLALAGTGFGFRIKDTVNNKYLTGNLGALGSGETLGSDILGGAGDFSSSSGWNLTNGFSIGSGILTAASGTGTWAYKSGLTITNFGLYKGVVDCLTASVAFSMYVGNGQTMGANFGVGNNITRYKTVTDITYAECGIYRGSGTRTGTLDNLIVKQVTAPSSSGLWLLAAPTIDSGFAFNTNYTYEIYNTPVLQYYFNNMRN